MRGYWGVEMKDVKIGSHSVLEGPAAAILDTGTSMIVGPYDDIGYIAAHIDAYCIQFTGISSSEVVEVSGCFRTRKGVSRAADRFIACMMVWGGGG